VKARFLGYQRAMPWRTVVLRGTRVLARCDAQGALREEAGKVEIRYRPKDGKAYQALLRNLELVASEPVLPDEHCGDARTPEAASSEGTGSANGAQKGGAAKAKSAKKTSTGSVSEVPVSDQHVIAYTDGACSGNPGPAGLGVVLLHGKERRELSEYLGVGTNNVAELTAILRALEAHAGSPLPLIVHTDSQYAIGVLSKGWKPKVNQALIESIKECMKTVKPLKLVYVPGHAGVPLNERADQLARAAVAARASSGWQPVRESHAEPG
jgi:ribonuclease HI